MGVVGLSTPLGAFADAADVGWHLLAGLQLGVPEIPVGIRADGSHHSFGEPSSVPKTSMLAGALSLVVDLPGVGLVPYLLGGVGRYRTSVDGFDATSDSGIHGAFGVNIGALVKRSLDAAKVASERHGIEAEVIDLRTIKPLDMERIAASVRKTNKVLVVHEDSLSWGVGAEISARIADELFEHLDGPVRRIASLDTWVSYAPDLEDVTLPQTPDVVRALVELAAW
jgi:hypothetical protein